MKFQNHSPRIQSPQWQNQTVPSSFTSGKYRQTPPNTFGCCFWPVQEAPAPKGALHPWGSSEGVDGGASPSLQQSQQMASVGAEQTRWWIFHTERFLLHYFQVAVAGWKMDSHLPVAIPPRGVPGQDTMSVWDTGLLSHTCPLWLCRKDGTSWDNSFITPHYTQKCSSISCSSVLFQTQPVGLTLHRHVELNSEQTQLPELQIIRRCFQWVREEL